jgi:outer membrane protein TolC
MISLLGQATRAQGPADDLETITLEQAHQLALRNHPTLKNIRETVVQAELLRWRAWALLLPNLSVKGTVTRADKEIAVPLPGVPEAIVIQQLWGKHMDFTANIALFNAQSLPLLLNAYDNIEASRLQADFKRDELLFGVTMTFYGLKSIKEAYRMAVEDLRTAEESLRLAKARRAVGHAVKVDVLQAEISVKEAHKNMKDAEDGIHLSTVSLGCLIGISGKFKIADPITPTVFSDQTDLVMEKAMKERRDLKALEIQRSIAERSKTHTWTKFIPTVDMSYIYSMDGAGGFSGEKESWRIIFGVKWNMLDGGQKIAELSERSSKIRQAGFAIDALLLNIREKVDTAVVDLKKARRNLELSEQQLALAEETQRLVSKQYEGGLVNGLRLIEATNTLSKARRARVVEELKYNLAILTLNKTAGSVKPQ